MSTTKTSNTNYYVYTIFPALQFVLRDTRGFEINDLKICISTTLIDPNSNSTTRIDYTSFRT